MTGITPPNEHLPSASLLLLLRYPRPAKLFASALPILQGFDLGWVGWYGTGCGTHTGRPPKLNWLRFGNLGIILLVPLCLF